MLSTDGREILKTAYQPSYPDFGQVRVSALEPDGRFAVWFDPTVPEKRRLQLGLRTHVTWLGADATVEKSKDIPDLPGDPPGKRWLGDELSSLLAPVIATTLSAIFSDPPVDYASLALSFAATLVSMVIGWRLARRYNFSTGARLGWTLFIFLVGFVGLLAFLCIQEWPAREPCPQCKKLRAVDRECCEHCDSPFPPPEKNGTEIFGALTKV